MPPSSPGAFPVGLLVNTTAPINLINHSIPLSYVTQPAATGHYDIDVNDSQHSLTGNQADLIRKDMVAAADEWMQHIDNPNHVPINIQINIEDSGSPTGAYGYPNYDISTGTGSNATFESAVEYKLANGAEATGRGAEPVGVTGIHTMSNGAQADVIIDINPQDLNSIWLDPNPGTGSAGLPDDKVDMVSLLAHEFGHGLGIGQTSSIFDTYDTPATFTDREKTTWESLLDIEQSGTTFTGSNAEQEHGGPVVVTTGTGTPGEDYQDFGNTFSDKFDPRHGFNPEVMDGQGISPGVHYSISPLDVAVLKDLGYKTKIGVADINPTLSSHDISATYFRQHDHSVTGPDIAATFFRHPNDDTAATIAPHAANSFGGDGINEVLLGAKHSGLAPSEPHVNHIVSNPTVQVQTTVDHINLSVATGSFVGDAWGNLISHATDTSVVNAGQQLQTAVHDLLHGISFSELPAHLLEAVHSQASIAASNHDATSESILTSVTHQLASTVDHMLGHFELPTSSHSEFAHLL